MLLHEIVETSRRVGETRARSEKVRQLAALLQRVEPDALDTAVAFLSGGLRQGRIGIGWAALQAAAPKSAAETPALTLRDVDAADAKGTADLLAAAKK